jgi:hypothetical protein
MANTLLSLSPKGIARQVLARVAANTSVAGCVNRQYANEFGVGKTPRIGQTIRVEKPTIYRTTQNNDPDVTGAIMDTQETSVDVTVDQFVSVVTSFDDFEHALTLSPEESAREFTDAAADAIVNELDVRLSRFGALIFPNATGVAGQTPDDYDAVAAPGEILTRFGAPKNDRHLIIDPKANRFLSSTFQAGFNPTNQLGEIFREGLVSRTSGFDVYEDRNIATHQDQALTAGVSINGGAQVGSTINMTFGAATEGYNRGAVLNFAGVFSVDRLSGQNTGELQDFVVEATINAVAGAAAVVVFPAIVVTGPYATTNASPANGAAVTLKTAGAVVATPVLGRQNLAIHRDAMGLVMVQLPKYNGQDICEVVSYMGYSMRLWRDVDVKTTEAIIRMDMMFGMAGFYRRMGCRVLG